jgi:murein DD-endopeptidase MepM/ murein hydrolase activator NlpD
VELPRSGPGAFGVHRTSPSPHTHNGIDLPAREGAPFYAADAGIVEHATPNAHEGVDPGFSGYGRAIVVRSADSTRQLYAHALRADVNEGDRVDAGAQLGAVGGTAYTAAEPSRTVSAHLHFEVSPRSYPQPNTEPRLDPVAWLTAAGKGRVHPLTAEPFTATERTPERARSMSGAVGLLLAGAALALLLAAARARRS